MNGNDKKTLKPSCALTANGNARVEKVQLLKGYGETIMPIDCLPETLPDGMTLREVLALNVMEMATSYTPVRTDDDLVEVYLALLENAHVFLLAKKLSGEEWVMLRSLLYTAYNHNRNWRLEQQADASFWEGALGAMWWALESNETAVMSFHALFTQAFEAYSVRVGELD